MRHTHIALLGTGLMGAPMAKRLLAGGFKVIVWNRSIAKAQALAEHGAIVADTAAKASAQVSLVITMVQDGEAVAELLFEQGVAKTMQAGAVVLDMSSIKPSEAQSHAAQLAALGLRHIDAPVSGGTVGAEQGTLAIMAGGDETVFEQLQPVFKAMGKATHVGPSGAGQLAKLANQMIVGITIGAVAEALLLAEKGGANMAKVREAIGGGFAQSRILELHGQRMVERDFTKRAAMSVQLKDMRNALSTAQELGFQAPVTQSFEKLYAQAIDHGLADLDHSALFIELAKRNGMN